MKKALENEPGLEQSQPQAKACRQKRSARRFHLMEFLRACAIMFVEAIRRN